MALASRITQGPVCAARPRPRLLLGVMLLLLVTGITAARGELLDEAQQRLVAGDAEGAYQLLAPQEGERAGNPRYDYLLGISALDSGRATRAVFALERVLAVRPDDALARAEIARAYLALGERRTAEQELETVRRRADVPPEARDAIDRYLAAFRDRPMPGTRFRGHLALTLGYDSNVNSATGDSEVAIPVFGGLLARLDPAGTEASARFGEVAAGVNVTHPLTPDVSLIGGASGTQRVLGRHSRFETGTFGGYAGMSARDGDATYTLAAQAERFRLDTSPFRDAYGAIGQVRTALSPSRQVSGFVQYTRITYRTQRVRNANRFTFGGGYAQVFPGAWSPTGFLSLYYGKEHVNASQVEHLGHDFLGARLGGSITAHPRALVHASVAYERRQHGGPDPIFLVDREDSRFTFRVGVDLIPARRWTVGPYFEYTRNDSNVAINDYDRRLVALTVRRDFD